MGLLEIRGFVPLPARAFVDETQRHADESLVSSQYSPRHVSVAILSVWEGVHAARSEPRTAPPLSVGHCFLAL